MDHYYQRQHIHVPKFSNWDNDNIPYTIYFENARKEKAFLNPNDPEKNPKALKDDDEAVKASTLIHSFSTCSSEQTSNEEERSNTKQQSQSQHMSKGTHHGSYTTTESDIERSNSDYSIVERVKSDLRKSMSMGSNFIDSFSTSSRIKRKGGSHSLKYNTNHEATLVPEFGAWDVTDLNSGDGYTAIFSQIRKEKQIASRHIPSKTPSLNNCSKIHNQCGRPSSTLSKQFTSPEFKQTLQSVGLPLRLNGQRVSVKSTQMEQVGYK
ncbi:RPM1-interacting protein 4-like [Abrus precatorius]|uniref:RPM1-interacting protein 4-like n=1 Tax=Abrus precatorius TaxID=3816 RepID=A0A8B8MM17_ABRPR|nr:RPM1-interacting protein 4-like [Abrus precatorius]